MHGQSAWVSVYWHRQQWSNLYLIYQLTQTNCLWSSGYNNRPILWGHEPETFCRKLRWVLIHSTCCNCPQQSCIMWSLVLQKGDIAPLPCFKEGDQRCWERDKSIICVDKFTFLRLYIVQVSSLLISSENISATCEQVRFRGKPWHCAESVSYFSVCAVWSRFLWQVGEDAGVSCCKHLDSLSSVARMAANRCCSPMTLRWADSIWGSIHKLVKSSVRRLNKVCKQM